MNTLIRAICQRFIISKLKVDRPLAMIRDSGYRGPIGILDHRPELDAKKSLQENLDGLKTLLEKLGDSGTPK